MTCFWNIKLVRLIVCVCVCVCVLGSMCLTLFMLRDDFESLKCCLDPWLSCMFDCIHVCVFLLLKNYFLSNLNTSRHLVYLSSYSASFNHNLDSFSIAPRSIKKVSVFSIAARSIELVFYVDTFGQLLDSYISSCL